MAIRRTLVLVVALATMAACSSTPTDETRPFDLQAHRGGLGLVTESTIASFTNALELGVTTLEMDTQITADGVAVVTHDRQVSAKKCRDTSPGDTYVGKYINTLTLAQVKTLDCGSLRLDDYPEQQTQPGAQIPTLEEVLALVNSYDSDVELNIETKVEAASPTETAPREQFVDVDLATIKASGLQDRVTIQSFDWAALQLMHRADASVKLVALTEPDFLVSGSPWLGGLDGADPVRAIATFGASAISPEYTSVTPELIASAHGNGIKVIPWTVDDPETMNALMDMGVDGIITDYPDRLRGVMSDRGLPLPEPGRMVP